MIIVCCFIKLGAKTLQLRLQVSIFSLQLFDELSESINLIKMISIGSKKLILVFRYYAMAVLEHALDLRLCLTLDLI